jgi:hypothetical protein
MSPRRRTTLVALVAVLGIVLAAAITYGTSQLVRQHIGLASEPLTAGQTLLAPVTSVGVHTSAPAIAPQSTRSQTTPPAITVPRGPAPAPAPGKGPEASPPATSTSSGEATRSTSNAPATTKSPQSGSGSGGSGPTRSDHGEGTPQGAGESADKQRRADD